MRRRRSEPGSVARPRHARAAGARLVLLALLGAGPMAGCGVAGHDTAPTVTGVQTFVTLRYASTDNLGGALGDQDLLTADSVLVAALRPNGTVAGGARTDDGMAFVEVPGPGTYRLVTQVTPAIGDSSGEVFVQGIGGSPQYLTLVGRGITAWPNPFLSEVRLRVMVAAAQQAKVQVVSLAGTRLRTLADGSFMAGEHEILWDGTGDSGQPLAAGAYWVVFLGTLDEKAVLVVRAAPPPA